MKLVNAGRTRARESRGTSPSHRGTVSAAAAAAGNPAKRKGRKRRRSRARKRLSRHLGYAGLRLAHAVISRLPLALGLALSRATGYLAYLVSSASKQHALESLRRVYGRELSERQIRRRALEVFQHSIATAVEWVIVRRWSDAKLYGEYREVAEGLRQLAREIRATGGGIVGLTAHLGNWEVLSLLYHRFAPGVLVPVAKPAYFEKYQQFLHRLRTEDGMDVIYTEASHRRMVRAIRRGQMLGMLPDQNLRTNSGVFVDFFGRPAHTVTFPVALARKLDVRMVSAFLVREGGSLRRKTHRFQLVRSELFDVPRTGDEKTDLLEGTQEWTSRLEEVIRRYPEQWCWTYPRWRSTPEHPRLPHQQGWKHPERELAESAATDGEAARRASPPVALRSSR